MIIKLKILAFLSLFWKDSYGLVSSSAKLGQRPCLVMLTLSNGHDQPESSRRTWLGNVATIFGGSCIVPLLPAGAADVVKSASVCDPSVSAWQRGRRVVYILGTAHVSSSSAELAGNLVKDTHPAGVFVELDIKRIKGSGILANRVAVDESTGMEIESPTSRVIVPDIQRISSSAPSALPSGTDTGSVTVTTSKPPAKQNAVTRAAGAAVGNSIKGMYKKLDSAGFSAGEEFVVAIREGQKIGSDIVLGDRDVEVTLGRVAEALTKSDLNVLMKPDSELEKSLKELVPGNLAANPNGDLNDEQFRREFSDFVEVMKVKENVRKIMGELQRLAPAIYDALVGERDAYMAAGLNGLNEIETMVAVVGIAHVDGIERNLKENGWQPANLSCPIR
eukprot:scaffold2983_cov123-Cylindrotheca_fusiformis.AAC.11